MRFFDDDDGERSKVSARRGHFTMLPMPIQLHAGCIFQIHRMSAFPAIAIPKILNNGRLSVSELIITTGRYGLGI